MRSPKSALRAIAFRGTNRRTRLGALLLASLTITLVGRAADPHSSKVSPLIIHEWGTFTSLQNNQGKAIGGINSDDEPVPAFVHRLGRLFLLGSEVPPSVCQGAPHCHPDVTMRLETPVIYFHPRAGQSLEGFNVSATFKGGWLTEYYPNAETDTNLNVFGPLSSSSVSTLLWKDLQLGGEWPGPETQNHVWTAPRAVQTAAVRTGSSEAEKFLFYRGVAHLDAPLAVTQDPKYGTIFLRSQLAPELAGNSDLKLKSLWVVHIGADGRVAFRTIPPVTLVAGDKTLVKVSTSFSADHYSQGNREALKSSLETALISEGLFRDEARALLNTWELSYFKSSGWRVFFLVPRVWTDFYLPLKVSVPSEVTRVMVGRIELISQDQKDDLKKLASFSEDQIKADSKKLREEMYSKSALTSHDNHAVFEGRKPLNALGISIPKSYSLYLGLGRFRDALLLDEQKNHPSKSLDQFIHYNQLAPHDPSRTSVVAASAPRN